MPQIVFSKGFTIGNFTNYIFLQIQPFLFVWLVSCSTFYAVAGKTSKSRLPGPNEVWKNISVILQVCSQEISQHPWQNLKRQLFLKIFNILASRLTLNWEVPKYFKIKCKRNLQIFQKAFLNILYENAI